MGCRALWFTGPGAVELRPADLPALADGQVLVRTVCSGISGGTEMLAYRGELDPDMPIDDTIGALGGTFAYPFQYGYSCVGVVAESRSDLAVGALVFAFQPHQDMFVANASDVIALGQLDPREATMYPLVETALQISLDAGPLADESVAVFGLGAVGLLTALVLQRASARVIGVEVTPWRRDLAGELGIEAVAPDSLPDLLGACGRPDRVPLAIEVSGNPAALAGVLGVMAHEGVVLVASWYGTQPVPLPLGGDFHRRRLTIRSTQVSTIPAHLSNRWDINGRRAAALNLVEKLPLASLATHTFAFDRADDAYAAIAARTDGLMHAALGYS
jgi:2-desacetyl-2-hydroxyethyl bacteriochlorophyllide A dehydrogenase